MRKIIVILAVLLALLLTACVSEPQTPEQYAKEIIFWDESIPKEQCVGLVIEYGLTITNYNGVPVNWGGRTMVYLPAGSITFIMDAEYSYSATPYNSSGFNGRDWPFQWTFNPGDIRYLRGWVRDGEPAILVIDATDKTELNEQPAYIIPRRKGPLILQ